MRDPLNWMAGLVIFIIVAAAALLGYVGWSVWRSPTISLQKAEWNCTRSHTETYSYVIIVGKAVIPQYGTTVACDRYERK